MRTVFLALFLGMSGAWANGESVRVNGVDRPAYVPGEVLVKFRPGENSAASAQNFYASLRAVNVVRLGEGVEQITFAGPRDPEEVAAELGRTPGVEFAQPNYYLYALPVEESVGTSVARPAVGPAPADLVPAVADPDLQKEWGLEKIGAGSSRGEIGGSRRVLVAVIDSGIDYNHPDLAANMWRNPRARSFRETGVDSLGEATAGDLVGWDFVHNDALPYDDNRHGTHVAGTIGAVGGNGQGGAGVSPRVSLLAVKFLNAAGQGTTGNAIRSIDYAVSRGAKVINNSWGSAGSSNEALREAIQRAEKAGALFVAAAGNDTSDNDLTPFYPANYGIENMVTVAATGESDELGHFSNWGHRSVDLATPGVNIHSSIPGGFYTYFSGTSMAAPHVSGAAALLWAKFPQLDYRAIKKKLLTTGDLVPALNGKIRSGRRLNVRRALE